MRFAALILIILSSGSFTFTAVVNIRWCVISKTEETKCNALAAQVKAKASEFPSQKFSCVLGTGLIDCMKKIKADQADLITADTGMSLKASVLYQLNPVAAENYAGPNDTAVLHYYATIVMRSKKILALNKLSNATVCSAGVGTAEGWIMPLSTLINSKTIPVTQCNSQVQTAASFFNSMCAPGALSELFNELGDNPNNACSRCFKNQARTDPDYCSYKNMYAGSYGSVQCIHESSLDLAFSRHGDAARYAMDKKISSNEFRLLCPDGSNVAVATVTNKSLAVVNGTTTRSVLTTEDPKCNWGKIPSRLVLTSITRTQDVLAVYKKFLGKIVKLFGPGKDNSFQLFSSASYGQRDLMFSDWTQQFYDLKERTPDPHLGSVNKWSQKFNFFNKVGDLETCPLPDIKWCVISKHELSKCDQMKLAFSAQDLKPEVECIQGGSTANCMRLIKAGFADLITLDPAELYKAGKDFGLVPIAVEYYGDGTHYYSVAIVKKVNKHLLISNMKNKKMCHSGIAKATGWVVPINLVIDTAQVNVMNGRLMDAYAELISRACVPGALSYEYNPFKKNPINLCEACTSGGNDRCQRNTRELYYGDSGAFRCLVEGGDVAFARHTTVRENTGGRNQDLWARNRRADDYELLCRDGSRKEVTEWRTCNLGRIPGHTVVTGGHTTRQKRHYMWKLLEYALEYFSSDGNTNFKMFDSGYDKADLMFQDSAESLQYIPYADQNYKKWLGQGFLRMIQTLELYPEQSGLIIRASSHSTSPSTFIIFVAILCILLR